MMNLPMHFGRYGVWMIYHYNEDLVATSIHNNAAEAARITAKQAYGRVGFWPIGWDLHDAVYWWEERDGEVKNRHESEDVVSQAQALADSFQSTRQGWTDGTAAFDLRFSTIRDFVEEFGIDALMEVGTNDTHSGS